MDNIAKIEYFDASKLNDQILELWSNSSLPKKLQKDFQHPTIITPLLYPNLKKKSILFIGFNPSFSEKTIKKHKEIPMKDLWAFYNIENRGNLEEWISEVETSTKKHTYFKKFPTVTRYLNKQLPAENFHWEHIDLLLIRKTQQNQLLKAVGLDKTDDPEKITSPESKKFILEQIKIFKKLLENLEPKIIIVANAKASKIYKNIIQCDWSDSLGCYITKIGDRCVQTHLTGMLTQQRALDNESFHSLKWMIKNAYTKINRIKENV
ncbi:MAG: hypothetical protein ACTSRU_17325 [Candidatus Hodarchaeales archaeon]